MAVIKDYVNVNVALQTAVAESASFGTTLVLVDHDDIPIDLVTRTVTVSDFDDLTASTPARDFASTYFSQAKTPQELLIGRFINAASHPHFICGDHETDYTVWEAVADGSFTVQDDTTPAPLTDVLTGVDFTGITSLAQVATVLTAELAAIAAPNIAGIKTSTFEFDSYGRLRLLMSTTGAAAATVSIVSGGGGTDLTAAAFMDVGDGLAVPGYDAEDPTDALDRVRDVDDTWYNLCVIDASDAQLLDVAGYIEPYRKQCILLTDDTDAYDSTATTDLGYLCKELGYQRTKVVYTENVGTEYPDAAIAGRFYPETEGTIRFSHEPLVGVTSSGTLTYAQRAALINKGYVYIVVVAGVTHSFSDQNTSGVSTHHVLMADWVEARLEEDIFNYTIQEKICAYDNATLAAIEGFIRNRCGTAIRRRACIDTPTYPFTVNMPDADDFTAGDKATKELVLNEAFTLYLNTTIDTYAISGTISI